MPFLTIGEAAARLHTTPSTIRSWERRLGYPLPARSGSGHRLYDEATIALLGDALARGLSISSAVRQIREETGSHTELLAGELAALRFAGCDRLLEAAITMRGVCRAFDEIVMEAVDAVIEREENAGIVAVSLGWASDRALYYRGLATTPVQSVVIVVDCSSESEPLRTASDILQLQLRFQGLMTHTLRGTAVRELRTVARRANASAVLFVGGPPEAFEKTPETGVETVATFRCDWTLDDAVHASLSSRSRAAADELSALVRRSAEPHSLSAPNGGA
jgi:DNA-binding transcriptional MerR regulator